MTTLHKNSSLPCEVPTTESTLSQWLAYCERLHPRAIDMGLVRSKIVAKRLDISFSCPVITVAGTNGKGSTCAMLEAILEQASYRTAVFTSPHLVDFEERLRIQGQSIETQALIASLHEVEQARQATGVIESNSADSMGNYSNISDEKMYEMLENKTISLSYFEFTTLAILNIMARLVKKGLLDVVVLEVGLGGRLDVVNIIDTDCAIITSIDLDHTQLLGDTREEIGLEKAGIMRAGKPVVLSDPSPVQSIVAQAKQIGADLWQFGRDFNYTGDRQQWIWSGRDAHDQERRYSSLAYPALRGANQLINASGVIAALTALREQLPVTAQNIRTGLATVDLPARFQVLPGQPAVVLDVAHNCHSVGALAANLDAMGFFPNTYAIFGAMADKDIDAMLRMMDAVIDDWSFVNLPTARACSNVQLLTKWQDNSKRLQKAATQNQKDIMPKGQIFDTVAHALAYTQQQAQPQDRIVVFGSFYTVGQAIEYLNLKNT